jgi:predicted small lipoprotein YifL
MRRVICTISVLLAALSIAACGRDAPPTDATSPPADDGEPVYEADITVYQDADHGPQLCVNMAMSMPPLCGGPDVVGWDWDAVDGEQAFGGVTWGSYHLTGTFVDDVFTLTEPASPPRSLDDGSAGMLPMPPACENPDVVDATQGIVQWGTVDLSGPDLVATWVNDGPAGTWDGPFTGNVVVLPGAGRAMRDRIRQSYGGRLCVVEKQAHTADELARVQNEVMDADAVAHYGLPLSAGSYASLDAVRVEVWVADPAARDYAQQRWGNLVLLDGILRPPVG